MRRQNAAFRSLLLGALAMVTGLSVSSHAAGRFEYMTKKPVVPNSSATAPVETIVLAADGLSYRAFKAAQAQGLFKEFTNVGAHVAPFPSMTDLSWSTILDTANIFGDAGRIKSVEATYFDESTQSVQGDPRDYYRRLAFPKYYMGAFDSFFNPYVEGLMYFPTEEIPKLEVKTVVDELTSGPSKKVLLGYVGAVDSTAHTQRNRLFPVMKVLDAEVKRLIKNFKEKGRDVEVVLISDHGNIGRFAEGQDEQELIGVDIVQPIEDAGFKFVQQLKSDKDVAAPLMALGTWGPVYLKNRQHMNAVINEYRKQDWFDLAVYVNKNNSAETVMTVISANGEAQVQYDKKASVYYYYNVKNNPLKIAGPWASSKSIRRPIKASDVMNITASTPYPDSLYRLIESASERNFDYPDFILTLKDGYFIKSSLGAFTKMYRTHGSLTANSSFGLMASTKRAIPGQIRSKDILPHLNVNTRDLFGKTLEKFQQSGSAGLAVALKNYTRGVETEAKNLNQQRIFQYLTRFVSDTRPYFVVSEITAFKDAFKFDPFKQGDARTLAPMNFNISKFDMTGMISPEDVGAVTDAVLTAGSAENLMKDPRVERVKDKIGVLQNVKMASVENKEDLMNGGGYLDKVKEILLPAKRTAMKLYQIPYLLEKSLLVQEKPYIQDTRDLRFAQDWLGARDTAIDKYKTLDTSAVPEKNRVQKLLKEAIKEAELEDRIFPTTLDKVYNRNNLDDLTIVYVPGIYNSIFDREIFSLGLNALADERGLRVIQPPVESTCAADFNGDIISDFLKNDMKTRVARGMKSPRYLILGYSKGAVDTLQFFAKNPQFVSTYVKGFVAIAAPLHGSSILNKTDLPFALVSALSENSGPEICKKEKAAAKSLIPSSMQSFWRKNERNLIGLTRYFSVTFESDPEDSHIFMRATKLIGQFDENNDGVVTTSSSKFPHNLAALDLGTIKADHLAGILASRFNQKAFMKGLISTLSELDVNNDRRNLAWNTKVIMSVANAHPIKDRMYYRLTSKGLAQKIHLDKTILKNGMGDVASFSNTWELNYMILPRISDPADDYQPVVALPASQIKYDPYGVLDVQKLPDIMAGTRVTPVSVQNMPNGINMEYNHKNMVHFRMDHQFNYESRSPMGNDDNAKYGYVTSEFGGEPAWVAMRSANNSIRMTTLSYRFSPVEFSKMSLKLAVTKGVNGADPVKGKTGKDDSAFQVWFTIRDGRANGDRATVDTKNDKVFLFGYYWGDQAPGENRKAGDIFENWYSNKNIVVATLPEAKQLLLNNQDMLGKAQVFERSLVEDLKRAFPNKRVEDMDIVGITIQHDSNDAEDSSEAFFKWLKFMP
ncbi:hypothetical protein [Bdellovibrio sp. HCB337]|uniref:hypothetical protein n=1 Tax=Bdellovibrio sp. HCB337 TaxID=3394358 RepID=UPI0039A5BF51